MSAGQAVAVCPSLLFTHTQRTSTLPAQIARPPARPRLCPAGRLCLNTLTPAARLRALLVAEPTPAGLSPARVAPGARDSSGQRGVTRAADGSGSHWPGHEEPCRPVRQNRAAEGKPAAPTGPGLRPCPEAMSLLQHQRPQPRGTPGLSAAPAVGWKPPGHCTCPRGRGWGRPPRLHSL